MAFRKAIFYVLFALATINLISGEGSGEGSGQGQADSGPPPGLEGQGQPDDAPLEEERAAMFNPFGSFPIYAPTFDGSRMSEVEDTEEPEEPQSRFFLSTFLSTRLTSCNFNAQAGTSCVSCRQKLTCLRGNVGKLRTCRGLFRFCNNGRCSIFPGALCNPATAAPTTVAPTTTAAPSTTAASTTIRTTTI